MIRRSPWRGFVVGVCRFVAHGVFTDPVDAAELCDQLCQSDDPRLDALLAYRERLGDPRSVTREVVAVEFGVLERDWGVPELTEREMNVLLLREALRHPQTAEDAATSLSMIWAAVARQPDLEPGLDAPRYDETVRAEGRATWAIDRMLDWLASDEAEVTRRAVELLPLPDWVRA